MSISQLLKDSFRIAKSHPLIFVPTLAASIISVVLSLIVLGSAVPMLAGMASQAATTPEQLLAGAGAAVGGVFVVSLISGILFLLAHAMTVIMASTAIGGGSVTLEGALSQILPRLVPVIIVSILVGVIVGLGFLLLIIPGIVLAFLLMFSIVSVMVDGVGPFEALGRSLRTVTRNFGATFVFFLVVLALAILTSIVTWVVGLIPVLGAILTMLIAALFTGYVTIYMVSTYRELAQAPGPSPDAQA